MNIAPKRRWFQFSLKAGFVVTTLVSVPLAWLAYERYEVRKREAAIASLHALGGIIKFDNTRPFRPNWLRPLLGQKSFGEVVDVYNLKNKFADADLAHVANITELKSLVLENTQVTDAGLVHLAGLTKLKTLDLDGTQVTDAGLVHLGGLTKLERLELSRTRVTDEGVSGFWKAHPNVMVGS
jgi:internalin A